MLKNRNQCELGYYGINGKIKSKYFRCYRDFNEWYWYSIDDVIAWMPLPNQYESEVE